MIDRRDLPEAIYGALMTALASLPIVVLLMAALMRPSFGRDAGQWEATDADVRKWYRELMQPENPSVSCCGEADAYHADSFVVENGTTIAIITDTRDDGPLGRPHIEPGTRIAVPDSKLKYDAGNPTGHGVIFVQHQQGDFYVLCYITPGGV
jgi:hypothetical protein